jgi:hypothetical protein
MDFCTIRPVGCGSIPTALQPVIGMFHFRLMNKKRINIQYKTCVNITPLFFGTKKGTILLYHHWLDKKTINRL